MHIGRNRVEYGDERAQALDEQVAGVVRSLIATEAAILHAK
jgi:hypothetical protein